MQVGFLGGAREVGRIGVNVKTEKTQVVCDYGVMLDNEPGFPMHIPPKNPTCNQDQSYLVNVNG